MARFNRYRRSASKSHTTSEPRGLDIPHVDLLDAAIAASDKRNAENYRWVSDCGPDALQAQVDHFTRLIQLVGEADTAWRAYRAAMGQAYGTNDSNTPHDLGWLPRYTEGLERARERLAAANVEQRAPSSPEAPGAGEPFVSRDVTEDSGLSQQWLDYPESDTGGL